MGSSARNSGHAELDVEASWGGKCEDGPGVEDRMAATGASTLALVEARGEG
jgi:hypothetical protein